VTQFVCGPSGPSGDTDTAQIVFVKIGESRTSVSDSITTYQALKNVNSGFDPPRFIRDITDFKGQPQWIKERLRIAIASFQTRLSRSRNPPKNPKKKKKIDTELLESMKKPTISFLHIQRCNPSKAARLINHVLSGEKHFTIRTR